MPGKPKSDQSPAVLRHRAEKLVGKRATVPADADAQRMLHELEVHQIELEIQNDELRLARNESESLLYKYTELYDFAPVGYFSLSPEGIIRLANLTGSTMFSIGRVDLIGHSFAMLLAHGQRANFKTLLRQAFAAEAKQSGQFELANANLATHVVSIEIRRSPDGIECCTMVQDITGRIEAQEGMRVSEIRYRRLFEAAQDGVLVMDPATEKIIDANPFMTQLLGYSRGQLIGMELCDIGLLKDKEASRKMFRKLKRTHQVRYENLPLESKTGRKKEVEVVATRYQEDGQSVIQCIIRDIAARKLAEAMSTQNVKLKEEIVRREQVEKDLLAHRKEQSRLLKQSRSQQKQLRDLSHQILNAQEDERKRISRELHDVIAQTLVSINVHLEILDQEGVASSQAFRKQVSNTQLLVEKAVQIVHDFARELRPTMLDDLGLTPALQMYMKQFMTETGIRASLKTSVEIDKSETMVRTVLYRIAQESLTNVARHSKASSVIVSIEVVDNVIRMAIKDNGLGFKVTAKSQSRKKNRLGLIGMKERAEMAGGTFHVDSTPGGPTTVIVEIAKDEGFTDHKNLHSRD